MCPDWRYAFPDYTIFLNVELTLLSTFFLYYAQLLSNLRFLSTLPLLPLVRAFSTLYKLYPSCLLYDQMTENIFEIWRLRFIVFDPLVYRCLNLLIFPGRLHFI